ncbi:MAG: class I SAM-dependent methyltransferase [Leptolyngbyaceae cyanobacterium bins.59]|nr:class I SAM-dependent methyltransferase [Leptolyngbyaceae cyanobacterium bins.59]
MTMDHDVLVSQRKISQRTAVARRADYEAQSVTDSFIVLLLREQILSLLARYATPAPGDRALDIGCGRQPFRKILEERGYHYVSLDAQQNPEQSVDLVCEIDRPIPETLFNGDKFQLLLCTEVMEHVADWETAFTNFVKMMAPGAKLLITCPHFYPLHEEPHDFWRPTPYAFQYFADRFNLKILYQANAGDSWDVLGTLLSTCYTKPASSHWRDRLINRVVNYAHRWILKLLFDRRLQSAVQVYGPLYLSNVIVFEK